MRSRTYPGIYLGFTINLKGTNKVLDPKIGIIKKPRVIIPYFVPERVLELVNSWERQYHKKKKKTS